MELSFCDPPMICGLVEDLVVGIWKYVLGTEICKPFPRITYEEAMEMVGHYIAEGIPKSRRILVVWVG
jgi:aspartyl-tRNA synthetase